MRWWITFAVAVLFVFGSSPAKADVNLQWWVENEGIEVGDTVRVQLLAVASAEAEEFCAMSVIVYWDPSKLDLIGVDDNSPYAWLFSGFPTDYDGINETFADGDAYYQGWANFEQLPLAGPEGLLATTFEFEALAPAAASEIVMLEYLAQDAETAVYDDEVPGLNILGELDAVEVTIDGEVWPLGDANCDGLVTFDDISAFVTATVGADAYALEYPGCEWLNADVDCNGTVNFDDISFFVDCIVNGGCSCP